MLRRAGLLLRNKPSSQSLDGSRFSASRARAARRPPDHGLRQKLRHSTTMYEQQSGAPLSPSGQQQQQVVIPGLKFLAAAQAQAQTQVTSQGVVVETVTAMETITSIPPTTAAPVPSKYKTPAQKKRQKKQKAAEAAAAQPPKPSSPETTTTKPTSSEARDARTQPSAASGGIPDPSASYLALSAPAPSTLPASRRILVIMDLNGTLLHRPSKKRPFHFVERPHAKRFMQYCLDNFLVAIWSSARPRNVHNMVAQLLTPPQMDRCLTIWARDKFGLSPGDYDARVQCYKRLTTVWGDPGIQASHPDAARGGRWDQTNTVLVDDSVEKGRSEPHNILVLPEFAGVGFEKVDVLPQVHDYLNTLCWQANISSYMREKPFQLDAAYTLGRET